MSWCNDLAGLLFPDLCAGCSRPLLNSESALCTACVVSLPRTRFHGRSNNDLEKVIWGRFPFYRADAFLYMTKRGLVQQLIHEIKYRDNQELAVRLGEAYGRELVRRNAIESVDALIPVPLHPRKQKTRGYNQSELIARGMSSRLGTTLSTDNMIRAVSNTSQTRLSRFRRWANVSDIFTVQHPELLINQHILLVDDVITTGSTIEACTQALMRIPGVTISVACLAFPLH